MKDRPRFAKWETRQGKGKRANARPIRTVVLVGWLIAVAACSGPKAKPESPLVKEGSAMPETCCCKSTPIASEDALPLYETTGRMECSSKQGDCVDEVQCQKQDAPAP